MRQTLIAVAVLVATCAFAVPDNILRNAGFTICTNPGQPDYWGTGAPERVGNFYGNYRTSPDSPVSGTHSLMLRNEEGEPGWTVQSYLYRGIKPDADYSLSVWLRAAAPKTTAVLWMGPAKKEVVVSPGWQRFVWTAQPGASSWGYTIRFTIPKGTLWVAAPMWVAGAEPAQFALAPADGPARATPAQQQPQAPQPVPAITVPLNAPVTLSPFVDLYNGSPVQTQTQVQLSATDSALKIACDCSQPDMKNVQVVGDRHDSGLYAGECVEIFIAPERTAGPYYHFAVNPNGARAEEEQFDTSWDADWSATVHKRADGWTAEITIPWDQLPLGAKAGATCGLNVCRHAKATMEEYSEWSCTNGGFHNPARFGLVTLPQSLIAQRAVDVAWTGTWADGNAWGLTLTLTPGQGNAGPRQISAAVSAPAPPVTPPVQLNQTATFTPGKPVTVKLGPLAGPPTVGEYRATVAIATAGSKPAQTRRLRRTVVQAASTATSAAPLSLLLDRSYYTTEQRARLRVWCSDARASAAAVTVGAGCYTAKLPAGSGTRMTEIAVPLVSLPLGETPVTATALAPGGKSLDLTARDQLIKLAPQPYGTKVDRFSACFIVNGKPFVPYCMGIHSIGQIDRLQDIKDHGFNTICAGFGGSVTEEDLQKNLPRFNAFFDACRKLGLKVIWWNGGGQDYEKIRDGFLRNIAAFRDNDLIVAWYILDEPEGWWESPTRHESDLPQFKAAVTQADPYRPSFFNYYSWKPGYGGYGGLVASDAGSLDRYPIGRGGDAMKAMDDITRTMAADCLPAGKPVNIWLQLYGYDDAVREATPAEQRCQTYLCLIEGARSIMYFIYKPMGQPMWEAMLPLGREIEALTPVFAAAPPQRQITADTDLIRFMHRYVGGHWVIVCANRSTAPVKATFDLRALGVQGVAKEKFGQRVVPLRQGKLTDTFAPLATRVYVLGR